MRMGQLYPIGYVCQGKEPRRSGGDVDGWSPTRLKQREPCRRRAYTRIRVIERTAEALGRLATQCLATFSDADEARNGPETLKLEAGVGIEPAYTALQAAA